MEISPMARRTRPSIFVGSSTEGLGIAKALGTNLDTLSEVSIWSQGVFGLGQGNLESLVDALDRFDFAALVLTADDLVTSRDASATAPRDNVLFELGLFMGGLGRDRTFIVYDRTANLKLPSDLAGVSAATFEPHASGRLRDALNAATTLIEEQVARLGIRDRERLKHLSEAAQGFDNAAGEMQTLIKLIARSRKVELDVVTGQFGPFIAPQKLEQMHRDLLDLEETLQRSEKHVSQPQRS
jgi:hypothetical protein